MKTYRLLMKGRNALIQIDGKPCRCGFAKKICVAAENPREAELLGVAKIRFNQELKDATLNPADDPPAIYLETIWEIDNAENIAEMESNFTFFPEKRWWQFWKRN